MSTRVSRPLNNQTRKPVKFAQEVEPNRFKASMNPDPNMVFILSRYLLPITPEEVLNREFGESPIFKAINTTLTVGALGFAIGAGKEIFDSFIPNGSSENRILSFKQVGKSGLAMGVQLGVEAGMTDLIETSLSCYRGRARFYDRVVAGTVAGAVCGVPGGIEGVKSGAKRGAMFAAGMVALQTIQEWVF